MELQCLVDAAEMVSGTVNLPQQQPFGQFVLPAEVQVHAQAYVQVRVKQQVQASVFLETQEEQTSSLNDDRVHVVYRQCCRCNATVRESEMFMTQMSGGSGFCQECHSFM